MKTEFDRMFNQKENFSNFLAIVVWCLYLEAIVLFIVFLINLIPQPAKITEINWFGLKLLISLVISIPIIFSTGLCVLGGLTNFFESLFFIIKGKRWKQRWNIINKSH